MIKMTVKGRRENADVAEAYKEKIMRYQTFAESQWGVGSQRTGCCFASPVKSTARINVFCPFGNAFHRSAKQETRITIPNDNLG